MSIEEIAAATSTPEPAKTSDNQEVVATTEPAKTSDNPAIDSGVNVETPEQTQAKEPEEVMPYTDQEFEGIDVTKADVRRLAKTYEAKNKAYRELQSEYTKVTQRQSVEANKTGRPTNPKDAFVWDVIDAANKDDYVSVNRMIGSVDAVIERKRADLIQAMATFNEDDAKKISQSLQDDINFKNNLNVALAGVYQNRQMYGNLDQSLDSEIFKAVPDFDKVAPEIGNFALNNLKMKKETIENTMDPRAYNLDYIANKYGVSKKQALDIAKQTVVDLTRTMHGVYMRMSGKGLQKTESKAPPKVSSGGSPVTVGDDKKLESLREKAKRTSDTDDWAAYYAELAK